MWRFRSMVVLGIAVGVLVLGATVAQGWWWNAQIDVEGTGVSTNWTVDGGTPEDASNDYRARIKVWLPEGANAKIISTSTDNEKVTLHEDEDLSCSYDYIEARIQYRVKPIKGADGSQVDVWVNAGGQEFPATGQVGEKIRLDVLIPAVEPDCYNAHDDDD